MEFSECPELKVTTTRTKTTITTTTTTATAIATTTTTKRTKKKTIEKFRRIDQPGDECQMKSSEVRSEGQRCRYDGVIRCEECEYIMMKKA